VLEGQLDATAGQALYAAERAGGAAGAARPAAATADPLAAAAGRSAAAGGVGARGGGAPRGGGGGAPRLTLRRLAVWALEPLQRMRKMAELCAAADGLAGGALASAVHAHARHGDPFVRGFARRDSAEHLCFAS